MLVLQAKAKNLFFDRQPVMDRLSKAKRRSLSRAGAFVRQRVIRSTLRKGKGPGKPGKPPKVHTDDPVANLRYVLFFYEPDRDTVVVGPVGLRGKDPKAPELMERGGTRRITEWALVGAPIVGTGRQGRARKPKNLWTVWTADAPQLAEKRATALGVSRKIITRRRDVQIFPRPFMEPSMQKEQRRFPNLFYKSVSQ